MWIPYVANLLALTIIVTGVVVRVRGLRGRVVFHAPLCRKCRYNLTGLISERCPECGSVVAEAGVIRWRRQRRWRLFG